MRTYTYAIAFNGEDAAGIPAYTEVIKVSVDSGNVGGSDEFENHLKEALRDWYEGARVDCIGIDTGAA